MHSQSGRIRRCRVSILIEEEGFNLIGVIYFVYYFEVALVGNWSWGEGKRMELCINVFVLSLLDLDVSSRYASSNVLAAVPPGTPRAVSHEDITR